MIELFGAGFTAYEIIFLLSGGSLGVFGLMGVFKKIKSINNKSKEENYVIPDTTEEFLDYLMKFIYIGELTNSDHRYIQNLLSKEREYQKFIEFIKNNAPEKSIFDKFNKKLLGGTFENEYKKYSTVMGEILKSFKYAENFFGIPVIYFRLDVGEDGKWKNKVRNTGSKPILFFLTNIDFTQHQEEFNTLKNFEKTIHKLEQDFQEYIRTGGNDKEIISLIKDKINNGEKAGQEIVNQLKEETNELVNMDLTEKSLKIFNNAYSVSYNY